MVQAVTNRNVIGVLLLALAGRAIVQVSLHCYPMLATVVTIRHGQLVQPKLGAELQYGWQITRLTADC